MNRNCGAAAHVDTMSTTTLETPLTTAEAAALLGLRPHTLANWRTSADRAQGLPWVKVGGRRVGYLREDVEAYLESCRRSAA